MNTGFSQTASLWTLGLLVLCAVMVGECAQAQGAWPNRAIKLVVPFQAGSATDAATRVVANKMAALLSQTVVVDNRTGASGNIGSDVVAHSAGDGYTILLGTVSTQVVGPLLNSSISYDAARDFVPIGMMASSPYILVTSGAHGFKNGRRSAETGGMGGRQGMVTARGRDQPGLPLFRSQGGDEVERPAYLETATHLPALHFQVGLAIQPPAESHRKNKRGSIDVWFQPRARLAVATPCTAPFMGVAIGYALSHGTAAAFGIFTALGLGMAAPLFAISALPGLARRLPRSGPWMLRFRQALGFPLMAALVWMAFVLSDLAGARALLSLLEGLLAAGLGAWLWGSWGGPDRRRGGRLVAAVLALALVAAGLLWAVRDLRPGTVPPSSAAALAAPEPSERGDGFWTAWSEARVAELRAQGHPVFVDFTAAWCLSCQVNEALALDDRAVRARFSQLGIVALKADWTARDEAIGKGLAALGRASVPLYALYPAGSSQAVILPEILTPGIVLGYLDRNIAQGR